MTTYKLRLDSIHARVDGNVKHEIWVLTQDSVAVGLHKDVLIPHYTLSAVLGAGTTQQVVEAYKDAIWDNRSNTKPVAETSEWSFDLFAAAVGALDAYQDVMEWLDSHSVTLPHEFTLESD